MARVNLREMFDAPDETQQLATPAPREEAPRVVAQGAPVDARINFQVSREVRNAFKAWCSKNDTTVKDELTAYIQRCIQDS
jgi:hypothetical protein